MAYTNYTTTAQDVNSVDSDVYISFAKEPSSYTNAISHPGWYEAIQAGQESIIKNRMWEESELPQGIIPNSTQCGFKTNTRSPTKFSMSPF